LIPFAFLKTNARWLLGGSLLMFWSSFGQTFFIGLFAGDIRAEFNLSHGDFGLIYMAGTIASAATMIWIGSVVDRHPPARVATLVIIGLAVTCFLMSVARSAVVLLLVIYGLRLFGQGLMTQVSMTSIGRWFSANRGRAVAISTLGFDAGVALLPAVVVLLSALIGWRQTWALGAIVLLIVAMPALRILFSVERTPAAIQGEIDAAIRPAVADWTRRQVLSDPAFWLINLGMLAPPFMGTAVMFHQIHLVETKGWPLDLFAGAYPIFAITTVIVALILGWAIDRWGAVRLLPAFLVPMAVGLVVLADLDSPLAIPVFMVLFGFNSAFMSTLNGSLWPEIYGIRNLGAIRSVIVALMVFSSALGPGLVGWLVDASVTLESQFEVMAVYCLAVTIILFLVSRHLRARMSLPAAVV
jgi:MFS family permease